jgi:mannose-6-phosphate isomerase-like protein (cupin superfamily)
MTDMTGYVGNIEELAVSNTNFREVVYTGQHSQLVLMSLLPNEDIGEETHETVDQFIRIEDGEANAIIDGEEHKLSGGSAIVVPAGARHNIINSSSNKKLSLYTIYSPAHHKDKTIHKTKEDAMNDGEDHI